MYLAIPGVMINDALIGGIARDHDVVAIVPTLRGPDAVTIRQVDDHWVLLIQVTLQRGKPSSLIRLVPGRRKRRADLHRRIAARLLDAVLELVGGGALGGTKGRVFLHELRYRFYVQRLMDGT